MTQSVSVSTADFDYSLPKHMIAQEPAEPRDASRLLVLHRREGRVEHRVFRDLGEFLHKHDLLVLNRTRVIPARIHGRKPTGGAVEILLIRKQDEVTWQVLIGGSGLKVGSAVLFASGLEAQIVSDLGGSERLMRFTTPVEAHLKGLGEMPLPPYIHRRLPDPERYQTVYARESGSAAAPTAGLHFTPQLLENLERQGVERAYVTLHVGLDTFAPVTEDDAARHRIHTEWCDVPLETATAINRTRAVDGRVIAVGTTSVRSLESAGRNSYLGRFPRIAPFRGETDLYILPGFPFSVVDAMITNFHLPKSTLLMLASAFAGRELMLHTYEIAKREGYRFYSFGDAMLIL
ncbi:MAG TPA: tRNA preQ1(34) S-adenosylmethionine ribosyltransferase-isomerase QueA [Anaerolineales bacterium]|nr:tRNA preQ1(34) S-adenosylmethionine ribosyltransferase-isomerase QueA [Anaerolineales bacterium]